MIWLLFLGLVFGTSINNCGVIDNPGTYELTTDITRFGPVCIKIETDNVVFDCQGHLIGVSRRSSYLAIYSGGHSNITIKNCKFSYLEAGVFLNVSQGNMSNIVIENISTSNEMRKTIFTFLGSNNTITNLTIKNINDTRSYFQVYFMVKDNEAGGIRDVLVEDVENGYATHAIVYFYPYSGRYLEIENVEIKGLKARRANRPSLIYIHGVGSTVIVRNITIKDINYNTIPLLRIATRNATLESINISNITLRNGNTIQIENVESIDLRDINVNQTNLGGGNIAYLMSYLPIVSGFNVNNISVKNTVAWNSLLAIQSLGNINGTFENADVENSFLGSIIKGSGGGTYTVKNIKIGNNNLTDVSLGWNSRVNPLNLSINNITIFNINYTFPMYQGIAFFSAYSNASNISVTNLTGENLSFQLGIIFMRGPPILGPSAPVYFEGQFTNISGMFYYFIEDQSMNSYLNITLENVSVNSSEGFITTNNSRIRIKNLELSTTLIGGIIENTLINITNANLTLNKSTVRNTSFLLYNGKLKTDTILLNSSIIEFDGIALTGLDRNPIFNSSNSTINLTSNNMTFEKLITSIGGNIIEIKNSFVMGNVVIENGINDFAKIYNNIFNISSIGNFTGILNVPKRRGTNIVGGPYLGGNFWANPSGTGYSETCDDNDQDGICDVPYYNISGTNLTDFYPLTFAPLVLVDSGDNNDPPSIEIIYPHGTYNSTTILFRVYGTDDRATYLFCEYNITGDNYQDSGEFHLYENYNFTETLNPGTYTFDVICDDGQGKYDSDSSTFEIIVPNITITGNPSNNTTNITNNITNGTTNVTQNLTNTTSNNTNESIVSSTDRDGSSHEGETSSSENENYIPINQENKYKTNETTNKTEPIPENKSTFTETKEKELQLENIKGTSNNSYSNSILQTLPSLTIILPLLILLIILLRIARLEIHDRFIRLKTLWGSPLKNVKVIINETTLVTDENGEIKTPKKLSKKDIKVPGYLVI